MSNTPNNAPSWLPYAAAAGGLAIFLLIVLVAYLPQRPAPLQQGALTPEERAARLSDMRAKEQKQANAYGWVDQQKGVVQLPISRAMQLTVQELNAKK